MNYRLQELLHLMLGWLAETKSLYKQTRADMMRLRVDQMGNMQQAGDALSQLAAKAASARPATLMRRNRLSCASGGAQTKARRREAALQLSRASPDVSNQPCPQAQSRLA